MSDDGEQKQVGLGKVIYSVESERPPVKKEERAANAEVEEGSRESFPASDPPAFSGSTATTDE